MATQTVPQIESRVVPFPQSTEEVSQLELAALLSLRARLARLGEQVESAEQSIRTRLEAGAAVEDGDHTARIEDRFRANIAWKEKAIDLAGRLGLNGAAWAQNVLTHTTKTRTVSLFVE